MPRLSLEEIIASDPRFKNVDINKARAYYNDAMNERNNTTVLPEFIVTAKRKNKNNSTTVYPVESESNFINRINQIYEDKRIAEATAFEKPLNFLSPTQYIGAAIDAIQGEKSFLKGVYDGNSGIVSDNFARNNPRAAALINMGVDLATGYITSKVPTIYNTSKISLKNYAKNPYIGRYSLGIPLRKNRYYRIVGEDAILDANTSKVIRSKTGWYHGAAEKTFNRFKSQMEQLGIDNVNDFKLKYSPFEFGDVLRNRFGIEPTLMDRIHFRPSTNHGNTVGFAKGDLFYKLYPHDRVIVGTDKSATFAKGHHGSYSRTVQGKDIDQGSAVVILENGTNKNATAPASNFKYYEPTKYKISNKIIYKRKKFNK